jgi:prolyl-tRNA synthetase
VLAPTGESQVFYDSTLEEMDYLKSSYSYENPADLAAFHDMINSYYAATEEKHDTARWADVEPSRKREGRGIEVGQIFYFGRKYSEAMKFSVAGPDGKSITPEMGSYGIGVSRLVGAIIEASHDEAGIIWPKAVAPFSAGILNLRLGDTNCDTMCETAYAALKGTALLDDRDERAGAKFADADLMGHPWQIIIGPRGAAAGKVELKYRKTGKREELSLESALERVSK